MPRDRPKEIAKRQKNKKIIKKKESGVVTAASWVTAVVQVESLAPELSYAVGAAGKKKKSTFITDTLRNTSL